MPKLIIQNGQHNVTGKEIFCFNDNVTATEMLMKHFPGGIDPDCSVIYINNEKINISSDLDQNLFGPLHNDDVVTIVNEVKALGVIAVIAIAVVAVAAIVLLKPKIPGNVGQQKNSPNNNLQGQTNIARPYQALPTIFGSPISYPDLTGEPITEFIDNKKIFTQLMNIGIGLFDIASIRAGDTPFSNFTDSSSTIYEPVDRVVTVPNVITSFATNEIDGQEILAINNGDDGTLYELTENGTNLTTFIGNTFTFQVIKDTNSDSLKSDFDSAIAQFVIDVNYKADFIGVGVQLSTSGSGIVNTIVLDGGLTFYTITLFNFTGEKDVNDTYNYNTPFDVTEKIGTSLGPIGVAIEMQELWLNFTFPSGLKGTVDFFLLMQELDGPNGDPISGPQLSFSFSITRDTLEQQFLTFKAVLVEGFYNFTISRTDSSLNSASEPDKTIIDAAYAINRFTDVNFGNNTLIEITMPATVNATSLRENKINLSLTSKLITYDGVNVVTIPSASRKMADALLHLYVDIFGLDPNTLALDELYEIQNRLDEINPELATFDFTFDDLDVSLDERMDTILQVARCFKWLDGDVYRFARDDIRPFASTTITRRDISFNDREYSVSYNPQLLESFDSVKVEFVDTLTNKKAYIFRTFDINSPDPENPLIIDAVGKNPRTMELAGCSEESNAINRAELEIRKLIYQRYALTETMLPAGMLLDKGDMVLYAEQYSSDVFDGEILAINGDVATTSESIDFSVGTLFIHYMLGDGTKVGPFSITEVSGQPFKFQSSNIGQAFVRDSVLGFNIQTGSRYIIGTTIDLDAARWTLIEKEARGNNVQLTMVTYDDRIYAFD